MSSQSIVPNHDPQHTTDIRAQLEFSVKFAALFFGLVYALGFLIIAIHHSTLSIPEFDPLKPKLFSAGIVFLLLVGLPVLTALRWLDFFGPSASAIKGITVDPDNATAARVMSCFFFWIAAYGFSLTIGSIFLSYGPWRPWGFISQTALCCIFIAFVVLSRKYFNRHADAFAFAALVLVVALGIVTFKFSDRKLFWATLWTYLIGLGGVFCLHLLRDPAKRRLVEWERLIPCVSLALFSYSSYFYPNIPPHLGGGKPTPSTFYFASKVPFTNASSANVRFLEETTSGYYILVSDDEKHGYFIRRDLVSAIHFGVSDAK
jgi:hypothetical protein